MMNEDVLLYHSDCKSNDLLVSEVSLALDPRTRPQHGLHPRQHSVSDHALE